MAGPTREQVLDALRTVNDPELQKDLVTLGMIKHLQVTDSQVTLTVELTTPACPLRNMIRDDVERAVRAVPGVQKVQVEMTARVRGAPAPAVELPGVKNVIAVGAGKGGVGKSTVSVLTAIGLARAGAKVGLLDADVYGPSIPKMLGIEDQQPYMENNQILPVDGPGGIKVISMGLLVDPGRPIIWRGPMIHNVLQQFLQQVNWGELDYLVVDLPPGTGDTQISLSQLIPITGAIMVTTPQEVSVLDVEKALAMWKKVQVPVVGVVENMSYYLCPSCGHRDEIFSRGGGRALAEREGLRFLGEIPLLTSVRRGGDAGKPLILAEPASPVAQIFIDIAQQVACALSVRNLPDPGTAKRSSRLTVLR